MNFKRFCFISFIITFLIAFLPKYIFSESTIYNLVQNDQDVIIYGPKVNSSISAMACGDLNGDGCDDLAIRMLNYDNDYYSGKIYIVYGGNLDSTIDLANQVDLIIYGYKGSRLGDSLAFGDVNGDGKKDLIMGDPSYKDSFNLRAGGVFIIYGKSGLSGTWDLTNTKADIEIYGANQSDLAGTAVASGDINNDGTDDILIGVPGADPNGRLMAGEVYLVFGNNNFPTNTIDLGLGIQDLSIYGINQTNLTGNKLTSGDVNGDGKDDIIVGAPLAKSFDSRYSAGEVYIIFGKDSYPDPFWDLATSTADIKICGAEVGEYIANCIAGDFNGDGKDDLILATDPGYYYTTTTPKLYLLYGHDTLLPNYLIDLNTETADKHQDATITEVDPEDQFGQSIASGDFDGDGKDDLFIGAPHSNGLNNALPLSGEVYTILNSKYQSLSGQFSISNKASSIIYGAGYADYLGSLIASGDLNGDGKDDLICAAPNADGPNNGRLNCGEIYIFYGFVPLNSPSININLDGNETNDVKVNLSLSVGGEPAEMLISGDITDSFKDNWIPYATTKEATLTGSVGTKTVTVKFRNALGRESEICSDTVRLDVSSNKVEAKRNRFNPAKGEKASFVYTTNTNSHLKIEIYNIAGELVRKLRDEERPPEIGIIEWDGNNDYGKCVGSGMYLLYLEAGAFKKTERILVVK